MPAEKLSAGLTREAVYVVTADMSPPHIPGILSTSRMISLIEDTCLAAVQPLLDSGQTTVGTRIDVAHVSMAREGETVTARIRLVKVTQGRLLTFEIEVAGAAALIASGTHQRLVVDRSRFARV